MDQLLRFVGLNPDLLLYGNSLHDWGFALGFGLTTFVVLMFVRRQLATRTRRLVGRELPPGVRLLLVLVRRTKFLPLLAISLATGSKYLRRELGDQGLLRRGPAGRDDARAHLRVVAELDAAFLDVRTGDVDLHRIHGRVVEPARDRDVLVDRAARDIGDEARLAEVEAGQDVRDHVRDAGVLQADRVQHAAVGLVDAVRRVAESRVQRGALEHDRAAVGVREALDAGVLLAEADAAGQQHDRGGELHPAEQGRE